MPPDVELTETAIETLRNLDDQRSDRIVSKLEAVVEFPDYYLDPLTNVPGYRLRVGDFRVVVDWDRENGMLYVVARERDAVRRGGTGAQARLPRTRPHRRKVGNVAGVVSART